MKKKNRFSRRVLLGSVLLLPTLKGEEPQKRKVVSMFKMRSLVQFRILTSVGSAIHKVNGIVTKVYYGNKSLLNKNFQFYVSGALPQITSESNREVNLVVEENEDKGFSFLEMWE